MKPITVIIPVYNAFDVAVDCIGSVLRTIPRGVKVCVIDDASPDGDLRTFLSANLLRNRSLRVLRNDTNLGFVGTCNRGMLVESDGDVILLNSDTVVTKDWVEKLKQAAYSRTNVGTVTPLTNNGTICSVPRFLENNPIPEGFTIESFAALVESLSDGELVEAPTCVGFCTYIRREVLDVVGVFDPIFSKGYGEENDLSLRAKQSGFVNLIDTSTFIFHRGNMSFKEMRESLSRTNTQILNSRYPDYEGNVATFCAHNPLASTQDRIWRALIERWVGAKGRTVLHVLHNGPFAARRHDLGGTEYHVQGIIKHDDQSAHFSLTPGDGCVYLSAHLDVGETVWMLPSSMVPSLLDPGIFSVVHLHHALGFDRLQLAQALSKHGNYLVSVHDYHLICGRLWLVKPDGSICDGFECGGTCGEDASAGKERRAIAQAMFEGAREVIVFSESTKRILANVFGPTLRMTLQHHGIEPSNGDWVKAAAAPSVKEPLKVLCVGTFVPHKGSLLVADCIREIRAVNGVSVEWHFLGRRAEDVEGLINHGEYNPRELRTKLSSIGAHVALVLPQCQETYSITLDELVASGMPVICSPFGALPERVSEWGVGYVCKNSVSGVREVLARIVTNFEELSSMREGSRVAPIIPLSQEIFTYSELYETASEIGATSRSSIFEILVPAVAHSTCRPRRSLTAQLGAALKAVEQWSSGLGS